MGSANISARINAGRPTKPLGVLGPVRNPFSARKKKAGHMYTVVPSGEGWAIVGPSMKSRYANCEDAVRRCCEMNAEAAHV